MVVFDDEWLAAAEAALASVVAKNVEPGDGAVDAVIDYVIAGSPSGKATIGVTVEQGRVTAVRSGKSTDPDVVVSMKFDAALKILAGAMSSDDGYMNGALKVEGAHARWMLDLHPLRHAAVEALAPVMDDTTL